MVEQQLAKHRETHDQFDIYALQKATAGLLKRWPIERVPWWLGKLHQISVPRGVVPNKERSPLGAGTISNILELLKHTIKFCPGDITSAACMKQRRSSQ